VESTVYRRGSDGKVIGTPEIKSVTETPIEPIFTVTTYRAGEIGQTKAQPKVVVEKPQPVIPTPPAIVQPTPPAPVVKAPVPAVTQTPVAKPKSALPKAPIFTLPKFAMPKISFGKSKSRYPRPVRYIRNIVLAYLGFYLILGFHAASSLDKMPASANVALADTAGTNWLLVGSDSREGLTKAERKEMRTGKDEGSQRTDTLMIIHIDDSGKPTLVSLPRDSYVTIPAHTALDGSSVEDRRNKINTAYGKGGAPLLVETVERNTGLHIDHYMEVGFKGIRDITDAVGGVNMCVPADVTDLNSGLNLLAGCQELNGVNALAYVRMRYADPKGDLGRIERQQQFLSSVMKKVATPAVLLNPISMWKLVDAGTASVNVGEGDSVIDISSLARAMRGLSNGNGTLTTVPVSKTDANTAAGSSVIWDDEAARELFVSLGAN
jgi:LCP family protein required for cell wall assembly